MFPPWSRTMARCLDHLSIGEHNLKIYAILLHRSIPGQTNLSNLFVPSNCLKYLTAFVPLAPVAHIPHIDASGDVDRMFFFGRHPIRCGERAPAPGSTGNQRPDPRRAALSPSLVTPGWTAAVKSSGQSPTRSLIPVTTSISRDKMEIDELRSPVQFHLQRPQFLLPSQCRFQPAPMEFRHRCKVCRRPIPFSKFCLPSFFLTFNAPVPWTLAKQRPVEVTRCVVQHPDHVVHELLLPLQRAQLPGFDEGRPGS